MQDLALKALDYLLDEHRRVTSELKNDMRFRMTSDSNTKIWMQRLESLDRAIALFIVGECTRAPKNIDPIEVQGES